MTFRRAHTPFAALGLSLALAAAVAGCPSERAAEEAEARTIFARIDAHIERANDLSLSNRFFEALREAQYGLNLSEQTWRESKRLVETARAQAAKTDPAERLDMDPEITESARKRLERAANDLAYFNEKIDFTFMRMIEGLAAEDPELRKAAHASFGEFCAYEHPAFGELRSRLLNDNRLRIDKIAYAHPGEVSRLIYDCLRSSSF